MGNFIDNEFLEDYNNTYSKPYISSVDNIYEFKNGQTGEKTYLEVYEKTYTSKKDGQEWKSGLQRVSKRQNKNNRNK